jgi:cytochrome c2
MLAACTLIIAAQAAHGAGTKAQRLWAKSPHGAMLERILPRVVEPRDLPEPASEGARLTARYCVQCHHLASPAMHTPTRWRSVVDRMVWRMRGNGNMGALMKEMMARVEAPGERQAETIVRYLQKHAQAPIDPKHPALATKAGGIFVLACSQCHALPDPQRHTAGEWPEVVARMKQHLAWTNTIVGSPELKTVPELKTEEIVKLLQRYARRD